MKILYGVQTTGNGHLSRSSLVVKHLKAFGHDVHVLFSGASQKIFWDTSVFTPYDLRQGVTLVTRNGRIDNLRTALGLNLVRAISDINSFDGSGYDLVLTDFEPLSARIARRHKIPSVGVSHQAAFRFDIPRARYNYPGKIVTRLLAPVDYYLGLHWHHFHQPILPPIVDPTLNPADCQVTPGKILVYLPFENRDQVGSALRHFTHCRFHLYEKRNEVLDDGNLKWNPFSREGFKRDLLSCEGVICQASFELPSEAIHLGKKLLVKPVAGQYEQLSNALVVEQYGFGDTMTRLDRGVMSHWLKSPGRTAVKYPDVALAIARWIGEKRWHDIATLKSSLWQFNSPETANRRETNVA